MATVYAQQAYKKYNSTNNYAPLKPYEFSGRVRIHRFNFVTGATTDYTAATPVIDINSGDKVVLGTLPMNGLFLEGFIDFGAMGASATAAIGTAAITSPSAVASDPDKFHAGTGATIDVSSAGTQVLGGDAADGKYFVATGDTDIILTAGGANYATGGIIVEGHFLYIVD